MGNSWGEEAQNAETLFERDISGALLTDSGPVNGERIVSGGRYSSCFPVSPLAVATVTAAARELAKFNGAQSLEIDRRLASKWFDMSIRPIGWEMLPTWDSVAGDYKTKDGWIKLHTNAAHHREAALSVLQCAATKEAVAEAVSCWTKDDLETAIVDAGGCAAAMQTTEDWIAHPQGRAVLAEPLIAWPEGEPDSDAPGSLEGIRVLDLTRILAGPIATRFLAGFGAQVLRIDPPGWEEPSLEPEVTLGKRCAALDLHDTSDRSTFEDLLKNADVLVHGYRPGALDALGFGEKARRSIAPNLVDVSLCAYGWSGPWATRRGYDSLVQMSCGIAAEGMRRKGSEKPFPLPVQALDHATGYLIAASVLRGLRAREKNGSRLSARLSLARTAGLLMKDGARNFTEDSLLPETEMDLDVSIEETIWGPARRIKFPIMLNGQETHWPLQAGKLKRHAPVWDTKG